MTAWQLSRAKQPHKLSRGDPEEQTANEVGKKKEEHLMFWKKALLRKTSCVVFSSHIQSCTASGVGWTEKGN